MRKLLLSVGTVVCLIGSMGNARSQNTDTYFQTPGGGGVNGAVGMCLTSSNKAVPCTNPSALPIAVSGSFSASLSGFAPGANGTPIAVTNTSTTGSLPAGAVVVASNVGSNGAYCTLGASTTNNGQYIPSGGGWFAFTVGSATQLSCITASGSTTINMVGGTGLPTGTGGGGGSGGGGAVTLGLGAVASGAYSAGSLASGAGVDGWDLTQGTKADTAYIGSGSASVISILKGQYAAMTGSQAAGSNTIGKVNRDYTSDVGLSAVVSSVTEGTHVLKASAGSLHSLTTTVGATTGWVMIFDATSAPADGAVNPKFCRYIKSDGTGGSNSVQFAPPLVMAIGISVAFSSTGCFTKTASATAFFMGQVQ